MRNSPWRRVALAAAMTVAGGIGALATSGIASATSAVSVAVSAGTLGFCAGNGPAATYSFPAVTLSGADQTVTTTTPMEVCDASGSGAGWALEASSTTFTDAASATLPTSSTTVQSAPSDACNSGVSCTLATVNSGDVTYPYGLPAAATAPTATKFFDASVNTGEGGQLVTPTWSLVVPASTAAGNYSSTWTITLVSGP